MTAITGDMRGELLGWLRASAVPYLSCLVVAAVLSGFLQYTSNGAAWVKGQPAGVIVPIGGWVLSFVLWLVVRKRERMMGLGAVFLALFAALWILHAVLTRVHGDSSLYSIWVVPPVLAMLYFKSPTSVEVVSALRVLGWAWVCVLVMTRALEITGVMDVFPLPPNVIEFDKRNYWLPFSGHFGLDGRWPGPYRHPNEVGVVGAFLVVLPGIVRGRSAWVFAIVGILTLTLAGTRVGFIAAAVGLAVLFIFGRNRVASAIPMRVRLGLSAVGIIVLALLMWSQSKSLSGRTTGIWPAFLDLWRDSPWFGVGPSGMLANGGVTAEYMHGHSLVVDELARNGLVGLAGVVAVLAVAVAIAVRALMKGQAAPAALIACYMAVGFSHTPADWLTLSPNILLLILAVMYGAGWLRESDDLGHAAVVGSSATMLHGTSVKSVER